MNHSPVFVRSACTSQSHACWNLWSNSSRHGLQCNFHRLRWTPYNKVPLCRSICCMQVRKEPLAWRVLIMLCQNPISNLNWLVMSDSWVGGNLQLSAVLCMRMKAAWEVADCCVECSLPLLGRKGHGLQQHLFVSYHSSPHGLMHYPGFVRQSWDHLCTQSSLAGIAWRWRCRNWDKTVRKKDMVSSCPENHIWSKALAQPLKWHMSMCESCALS